MESQVVKVEETVAFKTIKERVDHIRADANSAFTAVRHDYEEVVKAMRDLQAKSELRAFVTSRLKGNSTTAKPAKKARAPKVAAKTAQ